MKILHRKMILIGAFTSIAACAEQQDSTTSVALSKGHESELAESVFCSGTSEVLMNYSHDAPVSLTPYKALFTHINDNATRAAMSMKDKEGAAVDKRLDKIRINTMSTLNAFSKNDNAEKFRTFLEQTVEQCSAFDGEN